MDDLLIPQYLHWYKHGDYIHLNTRPLEHIYYLQKGLAAIYRVLPDGSEEIIRYARALTYLGVPNLFTTTKGLTENDTSIRACSDCKVYKIPFPTFLQKARQNPDILEELIIELSMESRYFRLLMTYTAGQKTANALALLLLNLHEEADGHAYIPRDTTYTDMASYLKTHKITISRIIKKLISLNVLAKNNGTLYITDLPQLEAYAHGKELIYWDKKSPDTPEDGHPRP